MKHFTLTRWIIVPAVAFTTTALLAQNAPSPDVGAQTMPADPVVTSPVPATPPVVVPPKPTKPAVKKPVTAQKKVVKKSSPGDTLRPGQFIWENRAAYKNPLKIIVVLDYQRLYVFDGEELVAFTTISTGKKGHETPTGIFKILQKNVDHKSNLYNDAPMPFMQRLTWDGIALHAGASPGYPASHGCVRMPASFAKSLFRITKMDQEVIIIRDTSKASQPSEPAKEEPKPVTPIVAEPTPTPEPAPQPQ